MSEALVWSEAPDNAPDRRLHDCTQGAALSLLVHAGYERFPLGIYTPAERNALDASDDRPDNTGATFDGRLPGAGNLEAQLANRYGVKLHRLIIGARSGLVGALRRPGRGFVLAGSLGHYRAGHRLRRHDPDYAGGHAVCYIAETPTIGRWLDPLAPNRYRGDEVTPEVAAIFAWTDWEARYLDRLELALIPDTATAPEEPDMTTTITISPLPPGSRVGFRPNVTTPLYAADQLGPVDEFIGRTDRNSWAEADATVTIERSPKAAPVGTFRRISSGDKAGLLAQKDTVDLQLGQTTTGISEAEVQKRVQDGQRAAALAVATAAKVEADKFTA